MSVTQLADQMYKEPHTVKTLIDRLKKEGFVETKRREANHRFVDITITDKGREKLEEAVPIAEAIAHQIIDSLDELEATELITIFDSFKQKALDGLAQLKESG